MKLTVDCPSALGLLPGLEAPVMTPNGVNFLFLQHLLFRILCWQRAS